MLALQAQQQQVQHLQCCERHADACLNMQVLDQALLRPGRFDRQVTVDRPDVQGRVKVLKVHSRGKSIGKDVDFDKVARRTPGVFPTRLLVPIVSRLACCLILPARLTPNNPCLGRSCMCAAQASRAQTCRT